MPELGRLMRSRAQSQAPWPVELVEGTLRVRSLRRRDVKAWEQLRSANYAWLLPWEATFPDSEVKPLSYRRMAKEAERQAQDGRMFLFLVEVDGELVGQVTVSNIGWGALRSAQIGYWIDRNAAGQGIIPTAVAMVTDHCFFTVGLHRIELNIRPENHASMQVARKLGFRPEGMRPRYLHIDGQWRDHMSFALTTEDVADGLLARWRIIQADMADSVSS